MSKLHRDALSPTSRGVTVTDTGPSLLSFFSKPLLLFVFWQEPLVPAGVPISLGPIFTVRLFLSTITKITINITIKITVVFFIFVPKLSKLYFRCKVSQED